MQAPARPELSTTLSLRSGDQTWGSERRMALLAAIDTEGSISAAARKVGLSYKAAWDAVDLMNTAAGDLLVERVTGGRRGGGAALTDRARQLLAWYQAAQAEHQRFMDALARVNPDSLHNLNLLHRMTLQTSARNRFEGTVTDIVSDGINDRVQLRLNDATTLTATLTHASTERLLLSVGRQALAFIKAQAVHIDLDPVLSPDPDTSPQNRTAASRAQPAGAAAAGVRAHPAENRWTGRISDHVEDATRDEITLQITPRLHVTGLAARDAGGGATPVAGTLARASFHARDVLIGTLD
ncbi:TOBE domain-containing protein [Castellaniella caeni]